MSERRRRGRTGGTLRDGTRSVTGRVTVSRSVQFRYRAPGGQWSDDEHVAERSGPNRVAHL